VVERQAANPAVPGSNPGNPRLVAQWPGLDQDSFQVGGLGGAAPVITPYYWL
jgi:hypothetical protein